MMVPYLRSVIARGGRSVVPCRNFTSSVSRKESKADTKSTIEIKPGATCWYLVLGFSGWAVCDMYDLMSHYVIPGIQAKFSRAEASRREANDT